MNKTVFVATIFLAACAGPLAGDQPPSPPTAEGDGLLSLPGMTLDLANRRITLEATVCLRKGALELLVSRKGAGRDHESILHTEAAPSDVHAALLALGLSPGLPARWWALPDGGGQAIPPRGARLTIRLRWTDDGGNVRECHAADWLELTGQEDPGSIAGQWVFVGSELMPNGAYWADGTGEVVCVSNFPSTLIDVPFESSSRNALLLYMANTDAIPPLGTKVEVVLTPVEGAENADCARASIVIDSNGDIHADGRVVQIDDLDDWAMDFMAAHRHGEVVIRTDPLALSYRVREAREELRIGGVYQIQELRMDLRGQLLPRTPQQVQVALDELQYDLGHLEELLEDPFQRAELLLEQIERERRELQRLDALWQQYAESVRQGVAEHERPAPPHHPTGDGPTEDLHQP